MGYFDVGGDIELGKYTPYTISEKQAQGFSGAAYWRWAGTYVYNIGYQRQYAGTALVCDGNAMVPDD